MYLMCQKYIRHPVSHVQKSSIDAGLLDLSARYQKMEIPLFFVMIAS